jgi:hypothetical protein
MRASDIITKCLGWIEDHEISICCKHPECLINSEIFFIIISSFKFILLSYSFNKRLASSSRVNVISYKISLFKIPPVRLEIVNSYKKGKRVKIFCADYSPNWFP